MISSSFFVVSDGFVFWDFLGVWLCLLGFFLGFFPPKKDSELAGVDSSLS